MARPGATTVRGLRLLAAVTTLLLTGACGTADSGPSTPGEGTPPVTTSPSPTPTPPGSSPSAGPTGATPTTTAATDLTIVVRDASGQRTTTTLTCDPEGGNHADPAAACAALASRGARALPAVRKDQACTQVYGGDATATLTGTWQGRSVRSSFSLKNGCEIARWKMLEGLLPPAGA